MRYCRIHDYEYLGKCSACKGVSLEESKRLRMLALRREAAYEIIGLMNPDVDRVEEIIARLLDRLKERAYGRRTVY